MPTQLETLTTLRDAAVINAHALDLITAEAEAAFQAMRLWPDSSVKTDALAQLSAVSSAYRNAKREADDMVTEMTRALQSFSSDPVSAPPAYPDIPTAGGVAQWSARDW